MVPPGRVTGPPPAEVACVREQRAQAHERQAGTKRGLNISENVAISEVTRVEGEARPEESGSDCLWQINCLVLRIMILLSGSCGSAG